jgi:hypothetical protein
MRNLWTLGVLAMSFINPMETTACTVEYVPWQTRSVWPTRVEGSPRNVRILVRVPWSHISSRIQNENLAVEMSSVGRLRAKFEEPLGQFTRTLSLHELTNAGEIGAEVQTQRNVLGREETRYFELVPKTPLRAMGRYVVLMKSAEGVLQLEELDTEGFVDNTPPVWLGIKAVHYAAHRPLSLASDSFEVIDDFCSGAKNWADAFDRALVEIYPATDDGRAPMRYGVWMTKLSQKIDYATAPRDYIEPVGNLITLVDLPKGTPRIHIGLRAIDLAGNLSPPSEIELQITQP